MKQADLAKALGKATAVIGNWENEKNRPDIDSIRKMLEIFKIDANTLFGWPPANTAKGTGHDILEKYRSLDAHGKEAVDGLLEVELKRVRLAGQTRAVRPTAPAELSANKDDDESEAEESLIEMKIYNEPAAAGLGNYLSDYTDNYYEMRTFPEDEVPDNASFGVLISGDRMEHSLHDGQIAWVEAQPAVDDGEIGIFVFDGSAYCKKLSLDRRPKGVCLVSLNKKYKDIFIPYSNVERLRTIGKVLL